MGYASGSQQQHGSPATKKRKARTKDILGWPAKSLINFLGSIGGLYTASWKMSPDQVTKLVNKYVSEHLLCDKQKGVLRYQLEILFKSHDSWFVSWGEDEEEDEGDDSGLFGSWEEEEVDDSHFGY
ncbi:hypothetical protein Tsubulata_001027 [Turnera subulata]|uniref:DM2 domain-containing protein n=1 Tax=Turnera subulata TaxID=218843 RepID=A0A9Q0J848_9ROSI|nr:hypothetical protein Tsubulata_001027 [Turnera subulata]